MTDNSMTVTRSRIETSIPRKHGPAIAGYESVCSLTLLQDISVDEWIQSLEHIILKHLPPFCRL